MDFKELFLSYEGRLNRQKYIIGGLILGFGGVVIIGILIGVLNQISQVISLIISLVVYAGIIYCAVNMAIKRAHDLDKSGHFLWMAIIPVVNIYPTVLLLFVKGTEGPNKYGADPLASD